MDGLAAKLNLAWNLLIYLVKRPFRGHQEYRKFVTQYAPDRLLPLTSSDKNWLGRFSECINCGLCDAACKHFGPASRDRIPGPSYWVTSFARALPDFPAIPIDDEFCESCGDCERICPNHVPIREAIEFIEAKRRELSVS